jgi:hypothetical protein
MSLKGAVWDQMAELAVWCTATANEGDGRGQTNDVNDRDDVEHCALPGFYSVIAASDKLLLLRRDDGGVTIAAKTTRPTGAAAGDRGILTDDLHIQVSGGTMTVIDLAGVSLPLSVARDDDLTHAYGDMITFLSTLATLVGVPTPVNFGQIDASTTHLLSD